MARTDDDSWDITESVGATALGVARRSGKPIFDVSDLFYIEPREDIAEWLTRHGWQTRFETSAEVTARYKPEVAGEVPDVGSEFVDAKLS